MNLRTEIGTPQKTNPKPDKRIRQISVKNPRKSRQFSQEISQDLKTYTCFKSNCETSII